MSIKKCSLFIFFYTHTISFPYNTNRIVTATYITLIPATNVVVFHLCGPFISIGTDTQTNQQIIHKEKHIFVLKPYPGFQEIRDVSL